MGNKKKLKTLELYQSLREKRQQVSYDLMTSFKTNDRIMQENAMRKLKIIDEEECKFIDSMYSGKPVDIKKVRKVNKKLRPQPQNKQRYFNFQRNERLK